MKKILGILILITLIINCNTKAEDVKGGFVKLPINNNLYYYTKSGGLAGSIEEIIFTTDTVNFNSKILTFFYPEIYYKIENQKVIIYAPNSSVKDEELHLLDELIEFRSLKNSSEINQYNLNYEKMKLQKISVYRN